MNEFENRIKKSGVCPSCGSTNIIYEDMEIDGNRCYYDFTCSDCGCNGDEEYFLEFKKSSIY